MADTAKIGKLLERFAQGVASHDRENPDHNSWGIGMAHFDIERLDLEEGEEILPGIVLQADGGVTGNFRVLCDGQHEGAGEIKEEEVVDAVGTEEIAEPIYVGDILMPEPESALQSETKAHRPPGGSDRSKARNAVPGPMELRGGPGRRGKSRDRHPGRRQQRVLPEQPHVHDGPAGRHCVSLGEPLNGRAAQL